MLHEAARFILKSTIRRSMTKYERFLVQSPQWAMASSFLKFLGHTQRRTTVGRTSLDEWSARRRDNWQHTTLTTDIHPCPRRNWNPQSQHANGRRPTP